MVLEQQEPSNVKLISLSEAAETTRQAQTGNNSRLIRLINDAVRLAALKGGEHASITVPEGTPSECVVAVMKLLSQNGFQCKEDKGDDVRDRSSWHNLSISWART